MNKYDNGMNNMMDKHGKHNKTVMNKSKDAYLVVEKIEEENGRYFDACAMEDEMNQPCQLACSCSA